MELCNLYQCNYFVECRTSVRGFVKTGQVGKKRVKKKTREVAQKSPCKIVEVDKQCQSVGNSISEEWAHTARATLNVPPKRSLADKTVPQTS
jgi:ribosomal protein S1